VRHQTDIEQDLARLADGTLAPERAAELEARVAESPELSAMLAEQRRVLDAIGGLEDRAPMALRERVEALRERSAPKRRRTRRYGVAGALTTAAAGLAVVLAMILAAGAGGPTLSQASAFSLKPATGPAPGHSFDGTLDLDVDGVPYPYWKDDFGWTATGSRLDKIDGRTATTVFYRKGKSRIGYTIVTGKPVSVSGSPSVTVRDGTRFRSVLLHGSTVVTWERKGHSCVLSGVNMSRTQLLKLAAWKDAGELPYSGS
jgi:anti-sigma factor RsiW